MALSSGAWVSYAAQVVEVGRSALAPSVAGGALSVAGSASLAGIAAVVSPGASVDWSAVVAGSASAVAGAVGALGGASAAAGALGAVAEAVPFFGQAVALLGGIVGALTAAQDAEEAARADREEAAREWCRASLWGVQASGEGGRVYPADVFTAPRDGIDLHARTFPPYPAGVDLGPFPRPMSLLGRVLILLLESPRMHLGDGYPTDGGHPWIGVSTEARRRWFVSAREAMQAAPPGSDGGLLLWPLYCDLAVDELTRLGATADDGSPIGVAFPDSPWSPALAWSWAGSNWAIGRVNGASVCDGGAAGAAVLADFARGWIDTYRAPRWAPGRAAARALYAEIERAARFASLGRDLSPGLLRVVAPPRRRVAFAVVGGVAAAAGAAHVAGVLAPAWGSVVRRVKLWSR